MAYNEALADRVLEALEHIPGAYEKRMFGGVCFMVDDKMCMGVMKDEMMCRIDPDKEEEALGKHGCRPMTFGGKQMTGYILVSEEGIKSKKEFDYWVNLCLEFNPKANRAKKKIKK